MLDLATWTSVVDLMALAASMWLGLYIVTRSPRSRVSWLAGLTLWSLSGYFLDSFLHLSPPRENVLHWWMGWTILFSSPLWFHLTTLLLAPRSWWHHVLVGIAYVWAMTLLVIEQLTGGVFGVWTGRSFAYTTAQHPGPWYPLVFLLLIVAPAASITYLVYAARRVGLPLRRQCTMLTTATALAAVGGAYLTLSVWMGWNVPLLPGQAALAVALVLLGYGVARYNALIEGRSSRVDFAYALLAIGAVVSIYLLVTWLSYLAFEIPFEVFIFVLMLVILTHSLYEWGGTTLERLFFRRQYRELRANLRSLAHEAEEHDVIRHLQPVFQALCQSLGCGRGWIAVREGSAWRAIASYPSGYRPSVDEASWLEIEETVSLEASDLQGTTLSCAMLVPLRAGAGQTGTIVLADSELGLGQDSVRELDLVETFADQVASVLYAAQRQDEAARQIDAMVSAFRERERVLRQELESVLAGGKPESGASPLQPKVEDALRHLYDYAYLGAHELAGLHLVHRYLGDTVEVITHLDRGKALSQALMDVIERLRPSGPVPKVLSREWVQYTILYDAYVLGELNRDIMSKLYISESSFNRARRRAVRGVARAVEELDRAARAGAA
jgi:hypothetical protein